MKTQKRWQAQWSGVPRGWAKRPGRAARRRAMPRKPRNARSSRPGPRASAPKDRTETQTENGNPKPTGFFSVSRGVKTHTQSNNRKPKTPRHPKAPPCKARGLGSSLASPGHDDAGPGRPPQRWPLQRWKGVCHLGICLRSFGKRDPTFKICWAPNLKGV